MGICVRLNKIITLAVVVLAGLWFLLVVVLPHSAGARAGGEAAGTGEGWRVESVAHAVGQAGAE
jgi:hypothetical protein